MSRPDMSVQIGPMRLKNPVLTASGTCGYGPEYAPYVDLRRLGGITTKSVTPEPRAGNAPPRVVETSSGLLNAIGLANVGLEQFLADKAAPALAIGTPIFVNVAGHRIEDYVDVCQAIERYGGFAGVELNVSCPNVSDGLSFGTNAALLEKLVSAVRPVVQSGSLIVKLSPNVTDITTTARAAIDGGADALSMINTFVGMKIDIAARRPVLANGTGGLSGPAIRPLAVALVYRVYREVARDAGIPIIGMGGISDWPDAVEFMLAGATAVSVGTALFTHPDAPLRIIDGLEAHVEECGFTSVESLTGSLSEPTRSG